MEGITQEDRSVCLCTKTSPCSPIPNFQFDARGPSGYCLTSRSLTYPTFSPNAAFIPVNLTFLTVYAPFSCMPSYPLLPSPWTLSTKLDGSNFRAQGTQLLPPLLLISQLFCSTVHTLLTAGTLSTGYLPWEVLWQGALSKDDTTNTHSIPHVLFPMCSCRSSKDRWGLGGHLYLHSQWNAAEVTPFIKGSVVSLEIHASEALNYHVRIGWSWHRHAGETTCSEWEMPEESLVFQNSCSSIPRPDTRHVGDEAFVRRQTQKSHERSQARIAQWRCYQIPGPPNWVMTILFSH